MPWKNFRATFVTNVAKYLCILKLNREKKIPFKVVAGFSKLSRARFRARGCSSSASALPNFFLCLIFECFIMFSGIRYKSRRKKYFMVSEFEKIYASVNNATITALYNMVLFGDVRERSETVITARPCMYELYTSALSLCTIFC